jgi:HD-like signal output (HDOD) protein
MDERQALARLDANKNLFTLPQVLSEILKVVEKETSSAKDIAEIILKDISLTGKILRVANSAFYGRSRQVTTVNQAVVTLGMRATKSLALSVSLYEIVNKKGAYGDFEPKLFWIHSLEVATAARMITEHLKLSASEELFVSGLLHDIGIIFLQFSFPKEYKQVKELVKRGMELCKAEEDVIGINHSRVGQYVSEKWNLPAKIGQSIGNHHLQVTLGEIEAQDVHWQIVNLANQMSKQVFLGKPYEDMDGYDRRKAIVTNLKLSNEDYEYINCNLLSEVLKVANYLEVDIGDPLELLHRANQELYRLYLTVEKLHHEKDRMQEKIIDSTRKQTALDSLQTVLATFSHYINNSTTTIMGRAQLIEFAIKNKEIEDRDGRISASIKLILQSVENISTVLEEMKKLVSFDTVKYHGDSKIIAIGEGMKATSAK